MIILYVVCAVLYVVSFAINRKKTMKALKSATKSFLKILPSFLEIILVMTILLYVFPPDSLVSLLSEDHEFLNILVASLIGSIAVIPGFIAFPIAGILKDIGLGFGVLAGFTTSLMMVGVLTFPVEKKYFGTKFAITRNVASFIIAIAVSITIGFIL